MLFPVYICDLGEMTCDSFLVECLRLCGERAMSKIPEHKVLYNFKISFYKVTIC